MKDTLCIYWLQRGKQLWTIVLHSIPNLREGSSFYVSYTEHFHRTLTTTSKIKVTTGPTDSSLCVSVSSTVNTFSESTTLPNFLYNTE